MEGQAVSAKANANDRLRSPFTPLKPSIVPDHDRRLREFLIHGLGVDWARYGGWSLACFTMCRVILRSHISLFYDEICLCDRRRSVWNR